MRTDRPARPGRDDRRRPGEGRRGQELGRGPSRGGDRPVEPRPPAPAGDLLYGRNAVLEAIHGRRRSRRLLIAQGVHEDERIRSLLTEATERGIAIERPFRAVLDERTNGANHQGVALEASSYPYVGLDEIAAAAGTILVLDHLQDPQNFGTLLRAAEATATAGVVIPRDRAVAVTPAVVNASAGAVEHLHLAQVPNLARAADLLKDAGWWLIGLHTGPGSVGLFAADLPSPVALVVGAEGSGIGPNLRRHCDLLVALPMRGKVASLNAATAGAVALFEIQRRGG